MNAFNYKSSLCNRRQWAFSLIELLVTLSIISLLMAIMIPALGRIRSSARQLFCAAQLEQIGLAVRTYAQDENHRIISAVEIMHANDVSETLSSWFIRLLPYIGRKTNETDILENKAPIWICPEDKDAYPKGYMNCPHDPMVTYAPNGYYSPKKAVETIPDNIRLGPAGGYTLADITYPSECFLMGESSYAARFYDADAPSVAAYSLPRDGHYRCTSGFYHNGTMNVLYVDGHVGNIKGRKTKELVWPEGYEQPYRNGQYMYWADLTLPSANEEPELWGPGY
jgi:prepilin-type processing-associated H-X9-DG protein/prepilin-type N-terminal cleavage/methylation domain-containing protein